jgi:hypothetical protein
MAENTGKYAGKTAWPGTLGTVPVSTSARAHSCPQMSQRCTSTTGTANAAPPLVLAEAAAWTSDGTLTARARWVLAAFEAAAVVAAAGDGEAAADADEDDGDGDEEEEEGKGTLEAADDEDEADDVAAAEGETRGGDA